MKESEYEWFAIKLEEYLLIIYWITSLHVVVQFCEIHFHGIHTYYTEQMVVWQPKNDEINTFYKTIKHHYLYYIFHIYFHFCILMLKLIYIFIKLSTI